MPTVPLLRVLGANSDVDDLERATDDLVHSIRDAGIPDVGVAPPSPSRGHRSGDFLWVALPLVAVSRPVLVTLLNVIGKWAVANRRVVRVKIGDAELDVEGGSAKAQSAALNRFLENLGYAEADRPAVGHKPARPSQPVPGQDAEDTEAAGQ